MNDSTGGDGGRRGRRRSATGAREDSRNVSVRLGTRHRASSSRTEPASLESGRTPPLPRRTRRCGFFSWGCSARSSRAHGGDARETHLRFFGAGGAARHQKGVALFRERHARGSGHRRSESTLREIRVFITEFFFCNRQTAPFLDRMKFSHTNHDRNDASLYSVKKEKQKNAFFFFSSRPPSPSRRPFSSSRRARATWRARRAD
jgi:hypothetical protein